MHPAILRSAEWARGHRRTLLVLAIVALAVIPATLLTIQLTGAFPGDRAIDIRTPWLESHHVSPGVRRWVTAVVGLASAKQAIVVLLALAVASLGSGGPRLALLPVMAAAVVFVSIGLKELVGPSPLEKAQAWDPTGTLPSNHVAFATSVFGYAVWLAAQEGRWIAALVCVTVIALMGPFSILKGAHWPSDVVAGYALGLAWLIGVVAICLPWAARGPQRGGVLR